MTRDRDIERVLDLWFNEGPSVMPDRALARVFERVDRTPQRRLASLLARFNPMSRSVQLGLAAAAIVVVAVVGLATFQPAPGSGASPSIQPTPSPSAATSAPAADPVPAALVGRWMGGRRDVTGIDASAGTSIVFGSGSFAITQSNNGNMHRLAAKTESTDASHIRLTAGSDISDCSKGAIGEYRWSLSPGSRVLTLTAVSDDCAARGAAVEGTWWKMDCPTKNDFCLGPVEAGRYSSQFFDPFLRPGVVWTPRYGALSYAVPAGWANTTDRPGEFVLARQDAPKDAAIWLWTDVVIVSEQDPCSEIPSTSVGQTAQAMADWLASATGLIASVPTPVSIGGLSGWRLDVSMDPSWAMTCPFSSGKPIRGIFTDTVAGEGLQWGVGADTHLRLFLLDRGDGRAVVANIEAQTKADYDALVDEATTVVSSFDFKR